MHPLSLRERQQNIAGRGRNNLGQLSQEGKELKQKLTTVVSPLQTGRALQSVAAWNVLKIQEKTLVIWPIKGNYYHVELQ